MNETLYRIWPGALLAVLGLLYLWIGLAAHGWDRLFGIVGGVLILAAAEAIRRSATTIGLGFLLLGSIPLAVATWWSIVTPVLAVLTLLMGSLALRRPQSSQSEVAPSGESGSSPGSFAVDDTPR